jgi:cytidylate kinase
MAVRQGFVVAIDGPAGAGKGTMARRIADHFRLNLLDTGLSYRAVAHDMLKGGLALDDEAAAVRAAEAVDLGALDREILSQHAVGEAASRIAVIPAVRRVLVDKQRRFARTPPGAVLDGRDIGTVVCPDAAVKIYVTASAAVRARRRLAEIEARGGAADAHLLDTSEMDIETAFQAGRRLVEQALAARDEG